MSFSPTERFVEVLLPAMGTSVTEGTIIAWAKAEGDAVLEDETLCEVATDKVDTECPSPATGVLAEILVEVGETADAGSVIARLAVDGAGGRTPPLNESDGTETRRRRHSPVVTRMAQVHELDLDRVEGTGRNGRVTKADVQALLDREPIERPLHSESPYRPDRVPPAPAAAAVDDLGGTAETLPRMRQLIGTAMRRSQETAATCHTVVECDMSRVEARRRQLGFTALPLISRATVETLAAFPDLNATLDGTTCTRYAGVHLGIAVSLGRDGLVVPVIRNAQDLTPEGLARRIKDVAARARDKQITPDELHGATFTITNPGAFGAVLATPVINLPQVAILDVEAVVRRPVVIADANGDEGIAIRPMVNLVLGWDHRAMDGMQAAQFLTALRARLESLE